MKKFLGLSMLSLTCIILLFPLASCGNVTKSAQLRAALDSGNLMEIDRVLDSGADVNGYDSFNPILYVWDQYADEILIEHLLKRGADVNFTDQDGNTLLMISIGMGDGTYIHSLDFTDLFLAYGADVNQVNADGVSALDYAIQTGYEYAAERLLKNGAQVSNQTLALATNGTYMANYRIAKEILLQLEAQNSRIELNPSIQAALLGRDTDVLRTASGVTMTDSEHHYLICALAAFCRSSTLQTMMDADDYYLDDIQNDSLLSIAVKYHNDDVLRYLLENGPYYDTKMTTSEGVEYPFLQNALQATISVANQSGAELLLRAGAEFYWAQGDLEVMTGELVQAVTNGDTAFVEFILEQGYPLDQDSAYWGMKAAIDSNKLEILKYFVDLGFDVNYVVANNFSLLSVACANKDIELAKYLIENGAHITSSELEASTNKNDPEMIKLLMAYHVFSDEDVSQSLSIARKRGFTQIIEKLEAPNITR